MTIILYYASTPACVIGVGGKLPWNIPADLKRFKEITQSHTVIMGNSTWKSLGRRKLPHRRNVVVTREASNVAGAPDLVFTSIGALSDFIDGSPNELYFIIGGAIFLKSAINGLRVDQVYISRIPKIIQGDTLFYNTLQCKLTEVQVHEEFDLLKYECMQTCPEREYLNLIRKIIDHGHEQDERTGTGALSVFGHQIEFDLQEGFPTVDYKEDGLARYPGGTLFLSCWKNKHT